MLQQQQNAKQQRVNASSVGHSNGLTERDEKSQRFSKNFSQSLPDIFFSNPPEMKKKVARIIVRNFQNCVFLIRNLRTF